MSEITSISIQFDIFRHRPIQTAVQDNVETVYKTLVNVEQNDLEFLMHGNSDTLIDLDIKLNVRGKIVPRFGYLDIWI